MSVSGTGSPATPMTVRRYTLGGGTANGNDGSSNNSNNAANVRASAQGLPPGSSHRRQHQPSGHMSMASRIGNYIRPSSSSTAGAGETNRQRASFAGAGGRHQHRASMSSNRGAPPQSSSSSAAATGAMGRLEEQQHNNGEYGAGAGGDGQQQQQQGGGGGEARIYDASPVLAVAAQDSAEDLRGEFIRKEEASDRLENVRACCDG
jgi:hypothetical protein